MTAEPPQRARTVDALRAAAAACRGCEPWKNATQTVFGEGPERSRLMLVGEQPGDQEDIQGEPFAGPAGKLLDGALARAGIDRRRVYLTNAVKHFRWTRRDKRRLHEKPNAAQVRACAGWRPRSGSSVPAWESRSWRRAPVFDLAGGGLRIPRGRDGVVRLRPEGCRRARISSKCGASAPSAAGCPERLPGPL